MHAEMQTRYVDTLFLAAYCRDECRHALLLSAFTRGSRAIAEEREIAIYRKMPRGRRIMRNERLAENAQNAFRNSRPFLPYKECASPGTDQKRKRQVLTFRRGNEKSATAAECA
jgi:hypothetical protein